MSGSNLLQYAAFVAVGAVLVKSLGGYMAEYLPANERSSIPCSARLSA
jgi:hypothetical protein